MGSYRLLLAVFVMFGHMGTDFFGRSQGVASVVSFFILSGFVMTALIQRNYSKTRFIPFFFIDRAMRIYPQYLLYVALSVLAFATIRITVPFLPDINASNVLANAILVPIGLYSWEVSGAVWIPQGWTLGLEGTFYAIIPFILIFKLEKLAFLVSGAVFAMAYLGYINTETWGYMKIPGTLFIFLCGSFLYQLTERWKISYLIATYCIVALMWYAIRFYPNLQVIWNYEVLQGFLIGLPAVALLTKLPSGKVDSTLGNISYGVYLNHSLIIWIAEVYGYDKHNLKVQLTMILVALITGWISYLLVERPVVLLRRRLRSNAKGPSNNDVSVGV